jgi:hypothetical protein
VQACAAETLSGPPTEVTRSRSFPFRAARPQRHLPHQDRIEHVVVLPGGYAVAAYASRAPGSTLFVSYAKAFRGEIASYWQATGCFAKFSSEREHECPERAVADALGVALMSLMNIGCIRTEPQPS